MEEAKELIRQKQMLEAQQEKPAAPETAPSDSKTPSTPGGPAKAADATGLPVYPGAKPVAGAPSSLGNTGDGIAMSLLETSDHIEGVVSFYKEKLTAGAGKEAPSAVEEKRDGKRIVRLSAPRDNGGLQTAEISEEPGKTVIQLISVSPGKATIPVPPAGSAGSSSLLTRPAPSETPASLPPSGNPSGPKGH